jgi:hypothetical protein
MRWTLLLLTLVCAGAIGAEAPATRPASAPAAPRPAAPRPAPPAVTPLRPFTAFCWSFPGHRRHMRAFYWFDIDTPPGKAAQITSRMDDGERVLLAGDWTKALLTHPNDACIGPDGNLTKVPGIWLEHGPRAISELFDNFLTAFREQGGKIDFLALDREENFSCWVMTEQWLAAIQADPRSAGLIEKVGFKDLRLALFRNSANGEFLAWNAVTSRMVDDATELSILRPLRQHFPRAGMSNYGGLALTRDDVIPDINGHLQYLIGEPCGTHQSPALYGGATPKNVNADWSRPYMQVVYAANLARCGVRNSTRPMIPWVAFKSFMKDGERPTFWGDTPYWEEGAWQSMLSAGTSNVLLFNPLSKTPAATQPTGDALDRDNDAMETLMAEMEQAAKGSRVTGPLTIERIPWDAGFFVSAARLADGAVLARVTFSENEKKATFQIAGKQFTVDRPEGKVGAWVRVP